MSTGSPAPAGYDGGTSSHGIFGWSRASGFIGVSIGVFLIIITAIASIVCLCRRASSGTSVRHGDVRRGHGDGGDGGGGGDVEVGINDAALREYPAVVYGETTTAGTQEACCPVCLESYGDSEVVRVLPGCGHLFHADCVDPWLRQRSTCPVCRTSPLPTLLAEVTPLAAPST